MKDGMVTGIEQMTIYGQFEFIEDLPIKRSAEALKQMSHDELVRAVHRWQFGKCRVAVPEQKTFYNKEIPDVLSFHSGYTSLFEIKVQRSDFLADKRKKFKDELSMGNYRTYVCPKGLIHKDELPEKWGLAYISESGLIRYVKKVTPHSNCARPNNNWFDSCQSSEILMLTSYCEKLRNSNLFFIEQSERRLAKDRLD